MLLQILQNGEVILTRELQEGAYKIGRASECEIQISSPQISKQHAMLVIKENRAAIMDLNSANGVFVNGVLVKKQRLETHDDVMLGNFRLRLGKGSVKTIAPEGAAAESNEATESLPQTPQEKLLRFVDQKVLVPFYGLMQQVDYRLLLGAILTGTLVLSVVLSVIPVVRWGTSISTEESLLRAQTILAQTVRENFRILAKTNDFTRLTVEAAEAERGILSCFVVDPKTSAILAPAKLFNKTVTDEFSVAVIQRVLNGKEEFVRAKLRDGQYRVAQPIYVYSPDTNERSVAAIVIADYETRNDIYSTFEPLAEAILFALLLSLLAFFFVQKMFTHPVSRMQEQLDAALKGESITVVSEAKNSELESLAATINFSISRVRQSEGVAPVAMGGNDPESEDQGYILSVREFDQGTSDALLLLDRDKRVKYVGRALEDLIQLRNQYALNQNISDACRDQSFAGTAIDMADQVISSLGETQTALLDINGISRELVGVAHKNQQGEIRFVLITVKLGNNG